MDRSTPPRPTTPRAASPGRGAVEFLLAVLIGLLISRAFLTEAYIVPTGSMAPMLLGQHRDLTCPACHSTFAHGLDDSADPGDSLCPNCGCRDFGPTAGLVSAGDRLLVQKHIFQFRPPRRWETAVFLNPDQPGHPFVKRVVGLPGEAVEIREGDVHINGRIAVKSLEDQRALRVLVHDFDRSDPAQEPLFSRWTAEIDPSDPARPGRWHRTGRGFTHAGDGASPSWISYHHRQPDWVAPGPIRDFLAYNGGGQGGDYRVDDLMLQVDFRFEPGARDLILRFQLRGQEIQLDLPLDPDAPLRLSLDGQPQPIEPKPQPSLVAAGRTGAWVRLEASCFDHALLVALDGRLLFEPIPLPDSESPPRFSSSPIALGATRGAIEVAHLRVYRDVYYTPIISGSFHRAAGVGKPYPLGPDEFFVLGDNSAISHDSRFWASGPVVRREDFIGKPFLVHLPSQLLPLKVFGWTLSWVPDPREIRYIR